MKLKDLYHSDFYAWSQKNSQALKNKQFDQIDVEHLVEELEIMGAREKAELRSRLKRLLQHLVKWQYQPSHRGRSWRLTIENQRDELHDLLDDNPSLKSKIDDELPKAYRQALREVEKETGLSQQQLPATAPYTLTQMLDYDFYPDK